MISGPGSTPSTDGPRGRSESFGAEARTGAVQAGTLDRGSRHVLSYHVILHWNRLGLSMQGQSILAWAARAAILHAESRA
nr:lantibiotic dehydratase C-terminal domain-containing protein [Streptomyces atroolivaceus]